VAATFFGSAGHVPRGEELAFLDVDRASGSPGGLQKIGLAAEEGGNLEHVCHLRYRSGLFRLVNVGQHRHTEARLDACKHGKPRLYPRPARRALGRAISLVEGGFENEAHPLGPANLQDRFGNGERMVEPLKLARPRDQHQRRVVPERDSADVQPALSRHPETCSRRIEAVSESIR